MKFACLLTVHFLSLLLGAIAVQNDMLNIFMVAHSHDDPGWLQTVDEYYEREVQYVYDTVVQNLEMNEERRFIAVETSYFSRWWEDQDGEMRCRFKSLVEKGQIEIILGGWVMHDEAVSNYLPEVNQMTLGHEYILKELGIKPKYGWQIDPFGASATTPTLWSLIGFDGAVQDRIDWRYIEQFKKDKSLEFIWQTSPNYGQRGQMMTHVLDSMYGTPRGFEWEHGIDGSGSPMPIILNPPSPITPSNVKENADAYIKMAKERASWYQTSNVLIPLGGDFNFQNSWQKYKNMDRLMKYINSNVETYNVKIQYATLSEYFDALSKTKPALPIVNHDFFPYADNKNSYWTGYFTSRPNVKYLSRKADDYLRTAEILFTLALHSAHGSDLDKNSLLGDIDILRRAAALVQHHDAVTGTEKKYVSEDYMLRIKNGIESASEAVAKSMAALIKKSNDIQMNDDPVTLSDNIKKGFATPIYVFNSLGTKRTEYLKIPLSIPKVEVFGSSGTTVPFQVTPSFDPDSEMPYELFIRVDVPPLGADFVMVAPSEVSNLVDTKDTLVDGMSNEYLSVSFDNETCLLQSIENTKDGVKLDVSQNFYYYNPSTDSDQPSGAYIFRPSDTTQHLACQGKPTITSITGPCVERVRQVFSCASGTKVTQIFDLYKGVPYVAGGALASTSYVSVGIEDAKGKEMISKFETNVESKGIFYTDANGLETQKRVYVAKREGDADAGVGLAGNFYPLTSRIFLNDSSSSFSVVVGSLHGGASLKGGEVEVMVHRRLLVDDKRGVDEPLNDTCTSVSPFLLHVCKSSSSIDAIRPMENLLHFKLHPIFAIPAMNYTIAHWLSLYNGRITPMTSELPENVHILSLQMRNIESEEVVLRLHHLFEKYEGEMGKNADIDLSALFSSMVPIDVSEKTLTLNADVTTRKSDVVPNEVVTLSPMDIRTFLCKLKSVSDVGQLNDKDANCGIDGCKKRRRILIT